MYTQGSPILPIGNIQQFQSAENTESDCSICILSDLNVWTSNGVGIFASVHDFRGFPNSILGQCYLQHLQDFCLLQYILLDIT